MTLVTRPQRQSKTASNGGGFLLLELVAVRCANEPDAFRGLLAEGMQELGLTEVEEQDRLTGWHLGGSL